MKIGIAGTHSTGKSTFVEMLRVRFQAEGLSVGIVGDLATAARDAGFPILRDHTVESTAWIVSRGISLELEAGLRARVVLVDRPVPDALGYLLAAVRTRGDSIRSDDAEYLRSMIRTHSHTYYRLLVSEIDSTLPIDQSKERDTDPVFRQMAAVAIDEVFNQLGLQHDRLPSSNREAVADRFVADAKRLLDRSQ